MDEAKLCSQVGCSADAVASYEWPGQGVMFACAWHALRAVEVMRAFGCPLVLRPHGRTLDDLNDLLTAVLRDWLGVTHDAERSTNGASPSSPSSREGM
ncbi:MAG: hypothetical protein M3O46_19820 [Myxococcota bacterium]|nr:hypothetical protein [Myxococcota bacterium]